MEIFRRIMGGEFRAPKSRFDNMEFGLLFQGAWQERDEESEAVFRENWHRYLDSQPDAGSPVQRIDNAASFKGVFDNTPDSRYDFISAKARAPYSNKALPKSWWGEKYWAREAMKHRVQAGVAGIALGLCGYAAYASGLIQVVSK